jgi:hypothetical protein
MKHTQASSTKVKSLETLTLAQSAQEALDIELERYRLLLQPLLEGAGRP